ncbi:hypothetical protein V5799_008831 [Amblyomma americanum]|uniref:THAP-type domain-containing protein n=1 Tax=Amblyomma americanum TaxID=6943 RepID=A0AAQ4FCB5_AMBAM
MPKGCCVPSCPSTERRCGSAVSFHEVPSDEASRDAWVNAITKGDGEEQARLFANARSVVCSLHFKPTDFKVGMKRRVLRPTAVPSIFPDKDSAEPAVTPPRKRRRRTMEPYYYYNVHSVKNIDEIDAAENEEEEEIGRGAARTAATPEITTIMILPGMVIRHER